MFAAHRAGCQRSCVPHKSVTAITARGTDVRRGDRARFHPARAPTALRRQEYTDHNQSPLRLRRRGGCRAPAAEPIVRMQRPRASHRRPPRHPRAQRRGESRYRRRRHVRYCSCPRCGRRHDAAIRCDPRIALDAYVSIACSAQAAADAAETFALALYRDRRRGP